MTKNEKPSETGERERKEEEESRYLSCRRVVVSNSQRAAGASDPCSFDKRQPITSPRQWKDFPGVTLFLSLSPIPHSEGHVSSTAAEWSIRGTPFSPPHRSRSSLDRKVQTNEGRRSIEGAFAFWHARLP